MKPNFAILANDSDRVLLKDIGPWDQHPTITNGMWQVLDDLASFLKGRRLEYLDSEGMLIEVLYTKDHFDFAPPSFYIGADVKIIQTSELAIIEGVTGDVEPFHWFVRTASGEKLLLSGGEIRRIPSFIPVNTLEDMRPSLGI